MSVKGDLIEIEVEIEQDDICHYPTVYRSDLDIRRDDIKKYLNCYRSKDEPR